MEWAMKDAVAHDTPDADAVLVYLVDAWPLGGPSPSIAYAEYSADGCGWAGSYLEDGSDCERVQWTVSWNRMDWRTAEPVDFPGEPRADFPGPLRQLGSGLAVEGHQLPQGNEWRGRFGALARQGADLADVVDEWMHWLLSASDSPLESWRNEPYVSAAAQLYGRRLADDEPATHEWEAAWGLADAADRALEDPAAAAAAYTAASACLVIMGIDWASNTASKAASVAVEDAARRDGNYDHSEAARAAARTRMADKLGACAAEAQRG